MKYVALYSAAAVDSTRKERMKRKTWTRTEVGTICPP